MKKHVLKVFVLLALNTACGLTQATALQKLPIVYRVGGGVSGEYVSIDGDIKNRPNPIYAEGDFSSNVHHSCRKFQMSPHIEVGSFLYDKYYFGVSLSQHYTKAQSSMKVPMTWFYNFEHTFSLESYTNVLVKLGYKPLPNFMFFGMVGPTFANWSHETKFYKFDGTASGFKDEISKVKSSNRTAGLCFGGGVEFLTGKNMSVSFQYGMHLHRTKNMNYDSLYEQMEFDDVGYAPVDRNVNVQKSVRLSYSTIGLRFSYFFSL